MHTIRQWSLIEEPVRLAMELPLSKEELLLLDRQEKKIRIVIEELKTIQDKH